MTFITEDDRKLNWCVTAEYRQISRRKSTKRDLLSCPNFRYALVVSGVPFYGMPGSGISSRQHKFGHHGPFLWRIETQRKKSYTAINYHAIHMPARKISVLLVDDDPGFAAVFQDSLLKARGISFRITRRTTVDEAFAAIKESPHFDIIVTDFVLPDLNGLEFCLRLSQMEQKIPVVMISATKDIKLAVEVMKLGVEDFLVKGELNEAHVPRTLVNILDRIKVKEQMRAVEKRMHLAEDRSQAIRELVVTVCHEFNNPLAAIKISSDLLQRSPLPENQQQLLTEFDHSFQKIESEVRRLRDITFEKIDSDVKMVQE